MKIDIYTHVMLKRYKELLYGYADKFATERAVQDRRPVLAGGTSRLEMLRAYKGMTQVLSTTMPPLEEVVGPKEATDLARICNDEMAEMVAGNPETYICAIANLPLNDIDASLKETERAIKELGFKGIQIYSRVSGKPPSEERLLPLFELMCELDLPIWIHPMRGPDQPDYAAEDVSRNQIFSIFGWPFDTTAAMTRLVFSGIFEKLPSIKFITHHAGGMAPYFADRLVVHFDNGLERLGKPFFPGLTKHPVDYLRMFYCDTALNGNPSALRCALDFFGEDRLLFGTDMPYDVGGGDVTIRQTIRAVEDMGLSQSVKEKIYEGNAKRLLHL